MSFLPNWLFAERRRLALSPLLISLLNVGAWNAALRAQGCQCPRLVTAGTGAVLSFAQTHKLPAVPPSLTVAFHKEPVRLLVEVDTKGAACSVRVLGGTDGDKTGGDKIGEIVAAAVRKWKFRPARIVGDKPGTPPVCMRSKVLVYVRKQSSRAIFVVPGLAGS